MGIQQQQDRIKFNVGGRLFETTSTTLANAGRDSFFGAMFDQNWDALDRAHVHFIDRNPECFAVLLDLLRTGDLTTTLPDRLLFREASFYGLLPHVRAAKWGPFDPNRLRPSLSVSGHAPGDPTALRASPDGGCALAHGSMVHVYDWTMAHLPPLTLSHRRVNDVAWPAPATLAVSLCERIASPVGSIALFSPDGSCASSPSPRHVLDVVHSGSKKSFTAGALAFGGHARSVFSSCRGRSNEYGVGVWDLHTGAQTDFFYEPPGWSLGEADKLQWMDDKNCLMVATLFPRKDDCYISLLDFREKRMAWHWSDIGPAKAADEKRVRDAVAAGEGNSVCVVNEYEELGFIDLRVSGGSVRWCSKSRLMKGKVFDEPCYPKLAVHEGQLFCSMNDCISVFCGPEWVLTSRLRRSYGGSICDFSIGGDRLFALHSEENVFDIWETPPPPIL